MVDLAGKILKIQDLENSRSCREDLKIQDPAGKI